MLNIMIKLRRLTSDGGKAQSVSQSKRRGEEEWGVRFVLGNVKGVLGSEDSADIVLIASVVV